MNYYIFIFLWTSCNKKNFFEKNGIKIKILELQVSLLERWKIWQKTKEQKASMDLCKAAQYLHILRFIIIK